MPSSRVSTAVRSPSDDLGVGLDPGALLADEEGDDLVGGAPARADRAALGVGLDLADGGEDGDDALVVGSWGGGGRVTACATVARRAGTSLRSLCQAETFS